MNERFYQLKKRYVLAAILKSVAVGVACGLIAVGTVLLALKLSALTMHAGYYALIATLAALLAGGVTYLIAMPTERKIAKKLDTEYGLHERVQTALAYQTHTGDIYDLQRDDTQSALNTLKMHKVTFKQVWHYTLACVLAVALLVASIVIPAKVAGDGPVEPPTPPVPTWEELPFAVTQAQLERLQELIEHVEGFELDESLKQSIADSIDGLLDNLKVATTNGEMQSAALSAIRNVDNSCKATTTYYKIGTSLNNMGRADVTGIIAEGAESYKKYKFEVSSDVTTFYKNKSSIADDSIAQPLADLLAAVKDAFFAEMPTISGIVSSMHLAIILSNVNGDDALYLEINNFKNSLDELQKDYSTASVVAKVNAQKDPDTGESEEPELTPEQAKLVGKLNELFRLFGYNVADILAEQSFTFAVDTYVKNTIVSILGLTSETGANVSIGYNLTATDNGSGKPSDDKDASGGFGKGDTIYGSGDMIYDPDTGEYVPYGQLINKYYAIVNAWLNEGKLTEEQASIIRAYFDMLLSGIKDNQETN